MKNNNSGKNNNGFPVLDHLLLPKKFVLSDMFLLSSWEIKLLLFFFYNLYSVSPRRFLDENTLVHSFTNLTNDLSDTLKATQNIVRVTLTSLVKKEYIKPAKRKEANGEFKLYYTLNFQAKLPKKAVEIKIKSEQPEKEILQPKAKKEHSASIEFIDEDEIVTSNTKDTSKASDARDASDTGKKDAQLLKSEEEDSDIDEIFNGNEESSFLEELKEEIESEGNKGIISKDSPDLELSASDLKDAGSTKKQKTSDKDKTDEPKPGNKPTEKEDVKSITGNIAAEKEKPDEELSEEDQRGKQIWDQLLQEMHIHIENYVYDTWLKPAQYYKYEDGVHLIKVESLKFYEKFEKQWGNLMKELLLAIDPDFRFKFHEVK